MALDMIRQYYAQYDAMAAPIGASITNWAKPEGWVLDVTKVILYLIYYFQIINIFFTIMITNITFSLFAHERDGPLLTLHRHHLLLFVMFPLFF